MTDEARRYAVNDCYRTIQGEGVQTGLPVVFLRLHGCPVACHFCDTKQTWFRDFTAKHPVTPADAWLGENERWASLTADDVVALVASMVEGSDMRWVVITGGEPAMQDLPPLVDALRRAGLRIAIETSGTAVGHLRYAPIASSAPTSNFDWITVSPKIDNPAGRPILADAIRTADELKFVVGRAADLERIDAFLGEYERARGATVCLQPMSQSKSATAFCIETCQQRGWRLSLQTHKYAGLA